MSVQMLQVPIGIASMSTDTAWSGFDIKTHLNSGSAIHQWCVWAPEEGSNVKEGAEKLGRERLDHATVVLRILQHWDP